MRWWFDGLSFFVDDTIVDQGVQNLGHSLVFPLVGDLVLEDDVALSEHGLLEDQGGLDFLELLLRFGWFRISHHHCVPCALVYKITSRH